MKSTSSSSLFRRARAYHKSAESLSKLGFNIELLGSSRYVLSMLSKMKRKDVATIREAFITYATPRFMKQFSLHLPYGYRDEYIKKVKGLDLERLAGLIKVCGFLLQIKVYLFWTGDSDSRARLTPHSPLTPTLAAKTHKTSL